MKRYWKSRELSFTRAGITRKPSDRIRPNPLYKSLLLYSRGCIMEVIQHSQLLINRLRKIMSLTFIFTNLEQSIRPRTHRAILNQMKCRLILNIVVRETATFLKLLASKNQALTTWKNSFLVVDLTFNDFNTITRFDFQSNRPTSQCFHKYLHWINWFAIYTN